MENKVAIIGAGYAGMAAAVELCRRGIPCTVFEASRVLGGRSRAVSVQGRQLDNGQHILIGAYRETLRLLQLVGVDTEQSLLRLPLHLEFPGEFCIHAPRLPAPLHLALALLSARGLNWREKWAAIRFMQAMQAKKFRLSEDLPLSALLDQYQQPARVRQYLWHSLCVAALNTAPEAASAQIFLHVLRDSLAAERSASDLLLPRVDLSTLFPAAAARYLQRHSDPASAAPVIQRSTAIRRIEKHATGKAYSLYSAAGHCGNFSQVIIATAPYHVPALLADLQLDQSAPDSAALRLRLLSAQLTAFSYQPITTCYLAYPEHIRLPQPMLGHAQGLMQWLFDRGQLDAQAGLLAAVISVAGPHLELSHAQLAAGIHAEIAGIVADLPPPLWSKVITEKRATWACTPKLPRPTTTTPLPGLLLAGDYIIGEHDYPATIEAAIRSGLSAAQAI